MLQGWEQKLKSEIEKKNKKGTFSFTGMEPVLGCSVNGQVSTTWTTSPVVNLSLQVGSHGKQPVRIPTEC